MKVSLKGLYPHYITLKSVRDLNLKKHHFAIAVFVGFTQKTKSILYPIDL